jgi:hypothetical protein
VLSSSRQLSLAGYGSRLEPTRRVDTDTDSAWVRDKPRHRNGTRRPRDGFITLPAISHHLAFLSNITAEQLHVLCATSY